MTSKLTIAKAVQEAARIREESYVGDSYAISMEDATKKAFTDAGIEDDLWYPFYLGFHWWNDMLQWAEDMLAGKSLSETLDQGSNDGSTKKSST